MRSSSISRLVPVKCDRSPAIAACRSCASPAPALHATKSPRARAPPAESKQRLESPSRGPLNKAARLILLPSQPSCTPRAHHAWPSRPRAEQPPPPCRAHRLLVKRLSRSRLLSYAACSDCCRWVRLVSADPVLCVVASAAGAHSVARTVRRLAPCPIPASPQAMLAAARSPTTGNNPSPASQGKWSSRRSAPAALTHRQEPRIRSASRFGVLPQGLVDVTKLGHAASETGTHASSRSHETQGAGRG